MANTSDIMARDMSSATKSILFASNTLFWVGVTCLEAPLHIQSQIEDQQANAVAGSSQLSQSLQQIQYIGMLAVRRTLEETNFVKVLGVFQKLSDLFYSFNLQMECRRQSLINILFNTVRNPLCTRDALKALILSIRIQDTRLLVGQNQPNLDEPEADAEDYPGHSADQSLNQSVGKVELIRLLYLLPYFMQQFLAPAGQGGSHHPQQDQLFQNKKTGIQLLKKSLPSIGINKKSDIFEHLETIQRKTANQHFERLDGESQKQELQELSSEFEGLLQKTVKLISKEGFKGSLMECYSTFQRLHNYQLQRYGPKEGKEEAKQASEKNDQPIRTLILAKVIGYLDEELADVDKEGLLKRNEEKRQSNSLYLTSSDICGEEVDNYKTEFRGLYFGIKNVILREIEFTDREIEVSQFFDQESAPAPNPPLRSSNAHSKRRGTLRKNFGGPTGQSTTSMRQNLLKRSGSYNTAAQAQVPLGNQTSEAQMAQPGDGLKRISEPVAKTEGADLLEEVDRQEARKKPENREVGEVAKAERPLANSAMPIAPNLEHNEPSAAELGENESSQEKKYCHSPTHSKLLGMGVSKYQTTTPSQSRHVNDQMKAIDLRDASSSQGAARSLGRHRDGDESSASKKDSKSKSRTRYQEEEDKEYEPEMEVGDQVIRIDGAPVVSRAQPLLKRTLEEENQPRVMQEVKQRSFADMTKEQHAILRSHQSQPSGSAHEAALLPGHGSRPEELQRQVPAHAAQQVVEVADDQMLTFQRQSPRDRARTLRPEPEAILELPDSQFDEVDEATGEELRGAAGHHLRQRHQTQLLEEQPPTPLRQLHSEQIREDESLSSRDQRRFYQAPLDPAENQSAASMQTVAHEFGRGKMLQGSRPMTTNTRGEQQIAPEIHPQQWAQYQQFLLHQQAQMEAQMRPQTTQMRPDTSTTQQIRSKASIHAKVPAALRPNFVAEKSSQIWSDVASQRSHVQPHFDGPVHGHQEAEVNLMEQNRILAQEMNQRAALLEQSRHSEKSFKSFTQISEHQKYSKTEPNFDFSSDEVHLKRN